MRVCEATDVSSGAYGVQCDLTLTPSLSSVKIRNTVVRIQQYRGFVMPCSFCLASFRDPDLMYTLDSPTSSQPDTLQDSTTPPSTPLCFTCMLGRIACYTFELHPHTHHTIHLVHTPHPPAHTTYRTQDPSHTLLMKGKSIIEIKA